MLEVVYQYRTLIGKCELGCGLDWDEIETVSNIERAFASGDRRRKFRRDRVSLSGLVRGDRLNDRVEITELGPGGLVCRNAPFIARGEVVEIIVDDGELSYRFSAVGVWLKDDGEDYRVGLKLVGMPVRLNQVQLSAHQADLVDRIAAAA